MIRFTNVPAGGQLKAAFDGVLKTMMSPRCGSRKWKMKRFASTRSEKRARQPGPGRAQCRRGSIDEVGIRYGFTTQALIASTIAIAPTIVTNQSKATVQACGSPSRSIGFLTGLRSGACSVPVAIVRFACDLRITGHPGRANPG